MIPSLHSPLIDQVVRALERQTARAAIREVIVVGQDRYGRVPPSARFVVTPRPLSAAAARNLGARQAAGEYLLFLDSDCIPAPDMVERLLARHRQGYPVVSGAVAIEPAAYWALCDNLLVFAPFLSTAPAGARAYVPSLAFSISRALFAQFGGFDERFPGAAGEDTDLSLRLRAAGHTLYFEPAARVAHRPQRSSARAIWQHLRAFGRVHYGTQREHRSLVRSPLARLRSGWASLLLAAAPLLACYDILRLFGQSRALRRYPHAFWGMVWGKIGWYWGVFEAFSACGPQ